MNYLIVGMGAVGTILSASIKPGNEDYIYAIKSKKEGEKILSIDIKVIENLKGIINITPNKVYQYEDEKIDVAFITTKSNYLKNMSSTFSILKKQNPVVISLMNGMGYEQYFDGLNIYYGIIMYNAFKQDSKVVLGSKGGLILDKRLENILKDKIINLPVSFVEDIDGYRYRKLWLNTINGFLSIFGFSLYQFFEESKKLDFKPLKIFIDYLEETKDLFERLKIKSNPLPSLDPETLISLMKKLISDEKLDEKEEKLYLNLPRGKNSTLQSIEKKEETEYQFLGGYLVKLADKINLPYKINRFVNEKISNYDSTLSFEFLSLDKIIDMFYC
ncbi:MAG TPA: 2-dehydropantoate 2-reductase N-terminal domain-containing protein [Exilispira sp.]|nr:2-dehydropantoate 2-reductase N-terminal domain-containing protein [Exilispira sp.]